MIRLRVYTDERDEGGWYVMEPWWRKIIYAAPGNTLDAIRIMLEEYGGTIPADFVFWSDQTCFIEFENDRDATVFLLRWS